MKLTLHLAWLLCIPSLVLAGEKPFFNHQGDFNYWSNPELEALARKHTGKSLGPKPMTLEPFLKIEKGMSVFDVLSLIGLPYTGTTGNSPRLYYSMPNQDIVWVEFLLSGKVVQMTHSHYIPHLDKVIEHILIKRDPEDLERCFDAKGRLRAFYQDPQVIRRAREIAGGHLPSAARTLEPFRRIKHGTTVAEAFQILGPPDRDNGPCDDAPYAAGWRDYIYHLRDDRQVVLHTLEEKKIIGVRCGYYYSLKFPWKDVLSFNYGPVFEKDGSLNICYRDRCFIRWLRQNMKGPLPPTKREWSAFKKIKIDMPMAQTVRLVGVPDYEIFWSSNTIPTSYFYVYHLRGSDRQVVLWTRGDVLKDGVIEAIQRRNFDNSDLLAHLPLDGWPRR